MTGPRYGIDAPGVVRNLGVIGVALLALALAISWFAVPAWLAALQPPAVSAGTAMVLAAGWMLVSSLWLKMRVRDGLLAMRRWRGDEAVLDVGCGRGLFAVGAAMRVPHGHVTAVDLWSARDLSDNNPAAIRANAAAAGVAGRVTVDTGDARALPYGDASFDVVGSMTVIHNIADRAERAAAIAEMWRVVRPGGQILLFDIRHTRAYAKVLRELGGAVASSGPIVLWGPIGRRLCATKPG